MRHLTFICYAHRDQDFMKRLLIHLKPYERHSSIEVWSDEKIRAGELWRKEIQNALDQAQAAILLVSPDFIASEFIRENELPPLLKAAEREGLTILWVPVSYSSYLETPIAKYQAASDPAQPLKTMTEGEQDRVWVEICAQLKHATWALHLELSSLNKEVRGSELAIKGKAIFRSPASAKDHVPGVAAALKKMNVQLVPFVFSFDSGWWAQKPVVPDANGDIEGSVYVGRADTADVGKTFDIRLCAIARDFSSWNKGLEKLPPVRIESKAVTVKRGG